MYAIRSYYVERAARTLAERTAALEELRESEQAAQADRDELRAALSEREREYVALKAELDDSRNDSGQQATRASA